MERRTRKTLLITGLTIVVWAGGLYGYLYTQLNQRQQFHLAHLSVAYQAVLAGYQEFADVTSDWLLADPETRQLTRQLAENGAASARGRLYRKWSPLFHSLREKHVRQLQFIDVQGNPQLRMHVPHRFGGDLKQLRPLVKKALASGQATSGFENGQMFSGFRYIYPVKVDNELVGVIDIGLSFTAIRQLIKRDTPEDTIVRFILKRKDLQRTIAAPDDADTDAFLNAMYMQSSVHPEYVTENLSNPLFGEDVLLLPEYASPVEKEFGRVTRNITSIDQSQSFSTHSCTGLMNCYVTSLLPITDHKGDAVAYIIAYAPDKRLPEDLYSLIVVFLVGSLLIGGFSWAVLMAVKTRQRMRVMSEHIGKGIYVIDRVGTISYINPACSHILGYSTKEMLGKNAHSLFHHESSTESDDIDQCPIREVTNSGQTFRGSNEIFRHKDGSLIAVEVTASPIVEAGEITSVVTVFDDIRQRLVTEATLRQTDAAFQNAVEGVLIADAEQLIIRVNPAFTVLTGYEEHEVVGLKPSILSSGQHSSDFFHQMWQEINTKGVWQGEISNKKKDGSIYTEWLSITEIRDHRNRLTNYVGIFHDISELKEKEARLAFMAQHDALTSLPNRNLLMDRLTHAIVRGHREDRIMAVLFVDLDRFKQVNDTLGHELGDALLHDAAQRISDCLREDDTVARQGGDEFVVLLEGISDRLDARVVATKIIDSMRPVFQINGHKAFIGVSIGIAVYSEDGQDAATLLRHADSAMYAAKKAGGNRSLFYHALTQPDSVQRLELESDLRHALVNNELVLWYQPKVNLRTNSVSSFEALVRWQHPKRGLLGANEFLPIAEEAGLMLDIGNWVLGHAVEQIARWWSDDLPICICVNLDGSQINQGNITERVEQLLLEHEVPPDILGVEITETWIAGQSEAIIRDLQALRNLGVSLAIDDFGTGHSSLTRLKKLPFQVLKIDGSFVRDMADNDSDRTIIKATIALADGLGLSVVAEGVETIEQLNLLKQMECDAIQGYLYARPMPADEVAQFLLKPVPVLG